MYYMYACQQAETGLQVAEDGDIHHTATGLTLLSCHLGSVIAGTSRGFILRAGLG